MTDVIGEVVPFHSFCSDFVALGFVRKVSFAVVMTHCCPCLTAVTRCFYAHHYKISLQSDSRYSDTLKALCQIFRSEPFNLGSEFFVLRLETVNHIKLYICNVIGNDIAVVEVLNINFLLCRLSLEFSLALPIFENHFYYSPLQFFFRFSHRNVSSLIQVRLLRYRP